MQLSKFENGVFKATFPEAIESKSGFLGYLLSCEAALSCRTGKKGFVFSVHALRCYINERWFSGCQWLRSANNLVDERIFEGLITI